jgi:hypothetical protein
MQRAPLARRSNGFKEYHLPQPKVNRVRGSGPLSAAGTRALHTAAAGVRRVTGLRGPVRGGWPSFTLAIHKRIPGVPPRTPPAAVRALQTRGTLAANPRGLAA